MKKIVGRLMYAALGISVCASGLIAGGISESNAAVMKSNSFNTSHCSSAATSTPSGNTLVIGSSGPLSGSVAAAGVPIYQGIRAYFDYINSLGGVKTADGKRKLKLDVMDDGFTPSKTIQNVQQLVEQDNAFAIGNVTGQPGNAAIAPYLTAQCIPQLFAEGATNGLGTSKYPFSSNAFPTLNQDGTAIGRYIKSVSPSATVAVLYENDNLGQPFLQGLESVLDGSKVKIVSTQSFDVSSVDVTNQMTTLAASKATYFVAGLTGAACTQSVSYLATSSWQPIPMVPDSCPAANFTSIPSSVSSKIIGANVLKGVVGPTYLSGSGVALYRKWMNKTGGQIEQPSEYGWYGASLDVSAIEKAKTLSRVDVAKAAASFPSLTPGIMLPGISIQGWQQGSPVIKKIAMLRFNPAAKDFGAPIAIENAIPVS